MKTACLCSLVLFACEIMLPAREFYVYFGTYTNALSRGIYVARLDAKTGKISEPQLAATTPNPSYLAISPGEKYLYAANELSGNVTGIISAFAIDKNSGKITPTGVELKIGSPVDVKFIPAN